MSESDKPGQEVGAPHGPESAAAPGYEPDPDQVAEGFSDATAPAGTADSATPDQPGAQQAMSRMEVVDGVAVAPVYRHGMFGVKGSGDTSGFGGLQRRVPLPPTAEKPYGSWFDDADAALAEAFPGYHDAVERVVIDRGELTLYVRRGYLLGLLRTLRDDLSLRFELLSGVSGVHYPDDVTGRPLHSVYQLTSLTYRRRLRVEVSVTDEDPHLPSAVEVYPTADWQERETYDLFGIVYDGHPGLTRILMPDDWVGHPQRKDYPLGGIPVEYKGATIPPPDERRVYQ